MKRWLLVLALCSCEQESPRILLVDITQQTGLDFVTTSGAMPPTSIIEVNGPGVCLFDADGDGDLDLFVANGASPDDPEHGPGSRLFRNMLNDDETLRFTDMTDTAGIDLQRWATSATAADFDSDGDDDLYVTCIGNDVLLRNDGEGGFIDVTAAAGAAVSGWSTGAAPGDIDGDGDLDLYITRYVDWNFDAPPPPAVNFRGQQVIAGPAGLVPLTDVLLLNRGDGTFARSKATADLIPSYGLNALMLDVDDDDQLEVLVGNDGMSNQLLERSDGTPLRLRDVGRERGFATNMSGAEQATMGLAVGDVDRTGTPDIISTNFSSDTNTLLITEGQHFIDRTNAMGIGPPTRSLLGWTTRLIDLDHDGDEDLLTLNGHVYPNATVESMASTWRQPALIQQRDGNRFVPMSFETGWLAEDRVDRSGACGDLDADGDIDLVTAELNGPVRIIENRSSHPDRRGIVLDLDNDAFTLGSHIIIKAGSETHHRWLAPGTDFQGWSAPQIHFSVPRNLRNATITIGNTTRRIDLSRKFPAATDIEQ
ncbi:MAG: FG-GAP-like repeat-containing protein [Phycisphaerales bacterium]|jgi:hypothetical protein|nr:FG-GAP-like repeat-containing protein [Phycisphaerales bacterium]